MSRRIEQVNSYLVEELNNALVQEIELPKNVLVTITKAAVSKDLSKAKVYISVLPVNQAGSALKSLNNSKGQLRHYLSKKFTSYRVPDLEFMIDDYNLKQRQVEREIERDNF